MSNLHISVRASALSLGVSGFLVAVATPWHPSIFDRPVDEVVRGFAPWIPLHLLAMVAVILAFIGAAGLVAAHEGALGRLGDLGLLVALVGVAGAAGLLATEASVFPVLADHAPAMLAFDGPLLTSPLLIAMGILVLGWPVGLAMLGVAAARSRLFGRWPGVLLAISGPLFLALEGPFVPVVGVLSALVFGAAQMWWAVLLWQSAGAQVIRGL
jgi:hypothetical protein